MNEVQKILELIRTVNPLDEKTLNEIDARVWCYLNDKKFVRRNVTNHVDYTTREWLCYPDKNGFEGFKEIDNPEKYTRSRDALKSIRPKGWKFDISNELCDLGLRYGDLSEEQIVHFRKENIDFYSETYFRNSTEELAELHGVIQVIAFEKGELE